MKTVGFFVLIVSVVLLSCDKDNTKQISTDLPAFSQIDLNSSFDVFLSEDTVFSIKIIGDKHVVDQVDYYVEDSILHIGLESHTKWLTPRRNKIELRITSQPLKLVNANHTCFIRTSTPITSEEFGLIFRSKANQADLELNCNTFFYYDNYPCGGKLTLSGTAQAIKIWNYAIVSVDASQLTTNYALVQNQAKNDCSVRVLEQLDYGIEGEGNIYLYGDPPLIQNLGVSSTGKLIQY